MLKSLDHVNVRTEQLERMKRFYCDVLGLTSGPRPNFSFDGAWIYCGDRPVVHLVVPSHGEAVIPPNPNDSLQHFAFAAEGLDLFLQHLEHCQVPFRIGKLADFGLCQVHLQDPDGNPLHIDFPLQEAEPS